MEEESDQGKIWNKVGDVRYTSVCSSQVENMIVTKLDSYKHANPFKRSQKLSKEFTTKSTLEKNL